MCVCGWGGAVARRDKQGDQSMVGHSGDGSGDCVQCPEWKEEKSQ